MTNNIYNEIKSYVYKGVHKDTKQIYFGYRSRNIKENRTVGEDFGIKYFTSSKKVKELGFDNFYWSVEFVCDDPNEAYNLEDELIRLQWEKDKSLSLNYTRNEHWNTYGRNPFEHKSKQELQEIKIKMSNSKSGEKNSFYNKKHDQDSKSKMQGKKWFNNGVDQTRAFECPVGFIPGMLHHPTKGKKLFNNGTVTVTAYECPEGFILGHLSKNVLGKFWFNNGIQDILSYKCPEGFIPGRLKKTPKGLKHFNNGIISVMQFECPEGFVPGMLRARLNINK